MLKRNLRTLAIGLALFSMFFGSGNLIFPLFVGKEVGDEALLGMFGFNLTAAILPLLGVLTMVLFEGDYTRFFYKISKPLGFLLIMSLLIFWVPLGSGPRCITLSFAAFQAVLGASVPLWVFSLIYCVLVYGMTYKRSRIIDILGYVLTPILLLALGYIMVAGFFSTPSGIAPADEEAVSSLWFALKEGYYTMDLIAAFFFSAAIIDLLKNRNGKKVKDSEIVAQALKSGVLGIAILIAAYCGLIFIASINSSFLQAANPAKDALLPTLTLYLLGNKIGVIASTAIGFACLTTSIALASVFSDFLRIHIFRNRITHGKSLLITTVITYFMSIQGFEAISKISSPAFEVFYPLLLVLIVVIVPLELRKKLRAP